MTVTDCFEEWRLCGGDHLLNGHCSCSPTRKACQNRCQISNTVLSQQRYLNWYDEMSFCDDRGYGVISCAIQSRIVCLMTSLHGVAISLLLACREPLSSMLIRCGVGGISRRLFSSSLQPYFAIRKTYPLVDSTGLTITSFTAFV